VPFVPTEKQKQNHVSVCVCVLGPSGKLQIKPQFLSELSLMMKLTLGLKGRKFGFVMTIAGQL
jgi:hypothetical protein